ncbi:hypothetical protein [Roseovarius sp.]|uniref:hypothetical protein n=1 Tax=Roseovarius sp. TaxID=1486281 RepID=UPI003A980FC1
MIRSPLDELVALFIAAKAKRQVIIVTPTPTRDHTDADQIIVAEAGPHQSGGRRRSAMWQADGKCCNGKVVCDILEGGEVAFRERARVYASASNERIARWPRAT